MTPRIRELLYVFGVVVFAALTVLSTFKIIDPDVAASVSAAVTAVLGLFGVSVAGTAAWNVKKQRKEGAFESLSPADQVVNGINGVIAQAEAAKSDFDKVKDAVASVAIDVVDDVPVVGSLAAEILEQLKK